MGALTDFVANLENEQQQFLILRMGKANAHQFTIKLGRGVLFVLMFIHFVLPFTPVNQHPELQIRVGSLILGIAFLFFAIRSFSAPFVYLLFGLILLVSVYAVSAATGASPMEEGLIVKIVFSLCLFVGVISALRVSVSR